LVDSSAKCWFCRDLAANGNCPPGNILCNLAIVSKPANIIADRHGYCYCVCSKSPLLGFSVLDGELIGIDFKWKYA